MYSRFLIITIGAWFLLMILAIINAGMRNEIYKPFVGELAAHQISTVIFIFIILVATYLIFRFSNINLGDYEVFLMGFIWLAFTVVFEFVAGHYVFGNSWDKLFADYNILKGRIWSLVLITIFFAPYITNKIIK
jgi:hypothetical protein